MLGVSIQILKCMMEEVPVANIMQQARDTKKNWEDLNPILKDGMIYFETDTLPYKEKRGNGILTWNESAYVDIGSAPPVDPYVHPKTHPASMITETSDRVWFTPTERDKLKDLHNGGGDVVERFKQIWITDGTITITKAGKYRFTGVAGGGGGSACQGQGGGSGQSFDKVYDLNVGDVVTIAIGRGGVGNVNYSGIVALPSNGSPYAGGDGGDTVITIKRLMGGQTETIVLKAGKGGTCASPVSIQNAVGLGENNGGAWAFNMFSSSTGETTWNGGDGGDSIFGGGGKGGSMCFGAYSKTDGCDGLSYGAGGGGAGFRMVSPSPPIMSSWTCGGDGIQGCFIMEAL